MARKVPRKQCSTCRTEKLLSEYHRDARRALGVAGSCRDCANARSKKHYYDKRNEHLAYAKRYIATEQGQKVQKRSALKFRYGITLERYNEMLAAQGGLCAVCKTDKPGGRWNKNFSVDHNHETGEARALLCHNCNAGLGHFFENVNLLKQAIDYVASFK